MPDTVHDRPVRSTTATCPDCGHPARPTPPLAVRVQRWMHLYRGESRCHGDVADYLPWLHECPCTSDFHDAERDSAA